MAHGHDQSDFRLERVTRTFPGVVALQDVSIELTGGEIHALVGENGAGKSTLINILSGVIRPDAGNILDGDEPLDLRSALDARQKGIVTVFQEAQFFPTLSVAENMALLHGLPTGRGGFVSWPSVFAMADSALDKLPIEPFASTGLVTNLSVAQRHMTQIAMALRQDARLIILDEPTSALTAEEAEWLFEELEEFKRRGAAILYVSHRQREILRLADRVTVLRDGELIWTRPRGDVDANAIIQAMVGRQLDVTHPPRMENESAHQERPQSTRLFEVQNLSLAPLFRDVSFDVKQGEVVGLYGVVGAGRTEIAQAIFGIRAIDSGSLLVNGEKQIIHSPTDAISAGIAYLPEDRLRQGIFPGLSIRANAVIATLRQWGRGLFVRRSAERDATREQIDALSIRQRHMEQSIAELSGGNQQKVVLARWLLATPRVLILDEPTRGVDVGAKHEIHQLLAEIANQGCAVLMISSELPEILSCCTRILVLREGQISASFEREAASPEAIAKAALPQSTLKHASQPGEKKRKLQWLGSGEWGLLLVVILLFIWLGATSKGFFSTASLSQLAADTAQWSLLGLAAAIVIIVGGIDISIGALLALSAAVAGMILQLPIPAVFSIPIAVVAALSVGLAGGLINGGLALLGRVHPIVVSLGTLSIYRGLVIMLLKGHQIIDLPPAFAWLTVHTESVVRGEILVGVVVALVAWIVLRFHPMGRALYAIGASRPAANLAGISFAKHWLLAFAAGGLLVGLAGLFELSASMQMQSRLAQGWELQAIAIAVIGGTSITGGRGSVAGVVLGALLLRLVHSALVRWEVQGDQVELVVGALILAAILVDLFVRRKTG